MLDIVVVSSQTSHCWPAFCVLWAVTWFVSFPDVCCKLSLQIFICPHLGDRPFDRFQIEYQVVKHVPEFVFWINLMVCETWNFNQECWIFYWASTQTRRISREFFRKMHLTFHLSAVLLAAIFFGPDLLVPCEPTSGLVRAFKVRSDARAAMRRNDSARSGQLNVPQCVNFRCAHQVVVASLRPASHLIWFEGCRSISRGL